MKRLMIALATVLALTPPLVAQDIPLSKILVEKQPWREAATDVARVTFLEADPGGGILIYQGVPTAVIGATGKMEKVPKGLTLGRDQTTVTTRAGLSFAIAGKKVVANVGGTTDAARLDGLVAPSCLTLWPDDGHLVIGESAGAWLWAVRIEVDGKLGPGDRYYSLRTRPGEALRVTAMTMDAGGLLYACTPLGIQVFDPTGRLSGVVAAPAKEEMTAITIGGENGDLLFVACGDKVYARKIQGKAIYTMKKPL